jgi:hypothetical protein
MLDGYKLKEITLNVMKVANWKQRSILTSIQNTKSLLMLLYQKATQPNMVQMTDPFPLKIKAGLQK